jgi:hypothetical protein
MRIKIELELDTVEDAREIEELLELVERMKQKAEEAYE